MALNDLFATSFLHLKQDVIVYGAVGAETKHQLAQKDNLER